MQTQRGPLRYSKCGGCAFYKTCQSTHYTIIAVSAPNVSDVGSQSSNKRFLGGEVAALSLNAPWMAINLNSSIDAIKGSDHEELP